MKKQIEVFGPYFEYSSPYGKVVESLNRDVWFVSRKLTQQELDNPKTSEIRKMFKEVSLGVIVRFQRHKRRYIIDQLFPVVAFNSLKKAVDFLVKNEGKLVFCT